LATVIASAQCESTQLKGKLMRKRRGPTDKTDDQFMAVKKRKTKFKGMWREKKAA